MIEEYETALEELKSSNEELVSVNEELQSSNEELEASKEELQSVNEELHTVNIELIGKVEALDRANNDLQNLFESTDIATVFLDPGLVIRSFTPAVAKIFKSCPATAAGRSPTSPAGSACRTSPRMSPRSCRARTDRAADRRTTAIKRALSHARGALPQRGPTGRRAS